MSITVEQKAYEHLRRKLARGALPPGSRVSAVAMAREIGISPTPVTQAIRLLQMEGLIELVPRLGTFVKQPDPREIEELFELRLALETFAVAKAVGRLTQQNLADLEDACRMLDDSLRRCRQLGEQPMDVEILRDAALADLRFHTVIVHASENSRIIKLMDNSHVLMRGMAMFVGNDARYWTENLQSTADAHREILEAIRRGDRKSARKALGKHLRDSIKESRGQIRKRGRAQAGGASSVYEMLREAGQTDGSSDVQPPRLRRARKPRGEKS